MVLSKLLNNQFTTCNFKKFQHLYKNLKTRDNIRPWSEIVHNNNKLTGEAMRQTEREGHIILEPFRQTFLN